MNHNKLLSFVLILLLNQFLTFCSDSTSPNENALIGTWNFEELSIETSDETTIFNSEQLNMMFTYIFKDDDSYTTIQIDTEETITTYGTGTWKTEGNKLKLVDDYNNKTVVEYSIINNKFTMQFEEMVIRGDLSRITQVFFKE
jgi:hypothetical protein